MTTPLSALPAAWRKSAAIYRADAKRFYSDYMVSECKILDQCAAELEAALRAQADEWAKESSLMTIRGNMIREALMLDKCVSDITPKEQP